MVCNGKRWRRCSDAAYGGWCRVVRRLTTARSGLDGEVPEDDASLANGVWRHIRCAECATVAIQPFNLQRRETPGVIVHAMRGRISQRELRSRGKRLPGGCRKATGTSQTHLLSPSTFWRGHQSRATPPPTAPAPPGITTVSERHRRWRAAIRPRPCRPSTRPTPVAGEMACAVSGPPRRYPTTKSRVRRAPAGRHTRGPSFVGDPGTRLVPHRT